MNGLHQPMAAYIIDFCDRILRKYGHLYTKDCISAAKITETVNYATRDLARVSLDLSERVSRQKYAGYYGFWFAKIAPISNVRRSDMNNIEVVDINERIAVELAVDLVANSIGLPKVPPDIQALPDDDALKLGSRRAPVPLIWQECKKQCSGECFKSGIKRLFAFHKYQNFEYIVHSLRHRSVGPYFLIAILESIVISSCESQQDFSGAPA